MYAIGILGLLRGFLTLITQAQTVKPPKKLTPIYFLYGDLAAS